MPTDDTGLQTVDQFANQIKSKFPHYRDYDNRELTWRILGSPKGQAYRKRLRPDALSSLGFNVGDAAPSAPAKRPGVLERYRRFERGAGAGEAGVVRDVVRRPDRPLLPIGEAVRGERERTGGEAVPYRGGPRAQEFLKGVVGLGQGTADLVEGLSRPSNLAILSAMFAVPEYGAYRFVRAAVSLGFSAQTAKAAADETNRAYQLWRDGKTEEAVAAFTGGVANAVFSALAGREAAQPAVRAVELRRLQAEKVRRATL